MFNHVFEIMSYTMKTTWTKSCQWQSCGKIWRKTLCHQNLVEDNATFTWQLLRWFWFVSSSQVIRGYLLFYRLQIFLNLWEIYILTSTSLVQSHDILACCFKVCRCIIRSCQEHLKKIWKTIIPSTRHNLVYNFKLYFWRKQQSSGTIIHS